MSDTVKLIIEIPKESLNLIKTFKGKFICNGDDLIQVIKNGIQLDEYHFSRGCGGNGNNDNRDGYLCEREDVTNDVHN